MRARRHRTITHGVNGRRGVFLLLFGGIYLATGASFVRPEAGSAVIRSMSWMPWWSPLWVCGLLWIGAGVAAVACAFQPIPRDRWGFAALASVAFGWTVAYVISHVVGLAPRGLVSALLFSALGAAVLVVSGMPNPIKVEL